MAEDELKMTQEQGDMDGPLVDHAAKGNTVELIGKEEIEGSDACPLEPTR